MPISVKMVNDSIKKISETNSLLDMLLEFEKVLDNLGLYTFANWIDGEVFEGPILARHYVNVKLIYPYKCMPDPEGAKRLMARDCLVEFKKDHIIVPVDPQSFDDIIIDMRPDGSTRYKAKTVSKPIWVVSIDMPRRYVDEFETDVVEADEDRFVDMESMNAETQVANDQMTQGNDFGEF